MTTSLFDKGLAVRKEVLGAEYVETVDQERRRFQSTAAGSGHRILLGRGVDPRGPVAQDAQHAEPRDALATLNRPHELELHLRGALRNGVTKDEIREVLLQVAIYAGVPAGVDSFRTARKVFAEDDAKAKK